MREGSGQGSTRGLGYRVCGNAPLLSGPFFTNPLTPVLSSAHARAGNSAERGGAIYLARDAYASVTSSTFDGNGATSVAARGGAIYTEPDSCLSSLSHSSFFGNGGGVNLMHGGAVYMRWPLCDVDISHCNFVNNSATHQGGAIMIYNVRRREGRV